MQDKRYKLAGWISIFYIIIIFLVGRLAWICFIYILLTFKRLLNSEYSFNDANKHIYILITIYIVSYVLPYIKYPTFPLHITGASIFIFALVKGLSYIIIGFKTRLLSQELYKLKKPLSYVFILNGICYASLGLYLYTNSYFLEGYWELLQRVYFVVELVLETMLTVIMGVILLKVSRNNDNDSNNLAC